MTTRLMLLHLSQWLLFNLLGVGAFGVLEGELEGMTTQKSAQPSERRCDCTCHHCAPINGEPTHCGGTYCHWYTR